MWRLALNSWPSTQFCDTIVLSTTIVGKHLSHTHSWTFKCRNHAPLSERGSATNSMESEKFPSTPSLFGVTTYPTHPIIFYDYEKQSISQSIPGRVHDGERTGNWPIVSQHRIDFIGNQPSTHTTTCSSDSLCSAFRMTPPMGLDG